VLTAERALGALVLLKAVDVLARGPQGLGTPAWALALGLFLAGGATLVIGRTSAVRAAWCAVLIGGAGLAVDLPLELRRQHLVLLMGVALAGLVARDTAERLLLWRVQLSALYGVAALSKLNESYLGGDVLATAVVDAPLWSAVLPDPPLAALLLAGVALIVAESALAVTPWLPRLRVAGTVLAALLHGTTLVLIPQDGLVGLRLVVFGGAAVVLHAASAGLLPSGRGPTRRGTCARWSASRPSPAGRPGCGPATG
jgi:hypothetical protein